MKRKPLLGLLAATALCSVAFAPVASAQTLQELKAQIDLLSKKIDELEKKEAAEKKGSDLKVKWKGAPEFSSADGKFKMKVRGRLYFDYGNISVKDGAGASVPAEKVNGTEVRTVRLGVEGTLSKDIKYKFEVDFFGDEVEVKDAIIQYKIKPVLLEIGHLKHMNSLEEQASGRYTTFMERGSFTDAFKLSRRIGISVGTGGKNWTVKAGYFFEGFDTTNASSIDGNLFAARVTFSPEIADGVKIHTGASFFTRSENGEIYNHGYSQRPHLHQAKSKYVSSRKFDIEREDFFGLELAVLMGPFSAQAEWALMKNTLASSEIATNTNPGYSGGYVLMSYYLTGESRSYSDKKGVFVRTKVAKPVSEGGMGAWQIAVRYDVLDLVHETFGEKQDHYTLGVNWHLNDYARIMANYSHLKVKDAAGVQNNKIDAFGARFQVDW